MDGWMDGWMDGAMTADKRTRGPSQSAGVNHN